MEQVLAEIKPTEEEVKHLRRTVDGLLEAVKNKLSNADKRLRASLVGSASRGTWLRREKDLDVFVFFPKEYDKKEMEEVVTKIAGRVLENPKKHYAEHPYVRGLYKGFAVELVPCYSVKSASEIMSAVDRTPFHEAFVKEHIEGKEDEVRLLKQFLKGIGCYGAEAKVGGFSGYLAELLVIKYGSFQKALSATEKWRPGVTLYFGGKMDEKSLREKFATPLIFIDPVDSERNVASALTPERFSKFIFAAREYLARQRREFFFPEKRRDKISHVKKLFRARGTALLGVAFQRPDVVEDILYPQLAKALRALEKKLMKQDFGVVDARVLSGKRISLLFELESLDIPRAKLHFGPAVNSEHQESFLRKHRGGGGITEPFIRDDRWAVFVKRKYSNAKKFLSDFLGQKDLQSQGIPSHVARVIKGKGFELQVNEKALSEDLLHDLLEYFDPRPRWQL